MKKFITNICALAVLTSAIPSFASSSQEIIRDAFANYTQSIEKGEGAIKPLIDITKSLQDQNISREDLIRFATNGMSEAETSVFKKNIESLLKHEEDVKVIVQEIASNMSRGANFVACRNDVMVMAISAGVAFMLFMNWSQASQARDRADKDIQTMKVQKSDLQSEMVVLKNEGVKPDSFLITNIQKDIDYLDLEIENSMQQSQKNSTKAIVNGFAAAAAATVGGYTFFNCR